MQSSPFFETLEGVCTGVVPVQIEGGVRRWAGSGKKKEVGGR